MGEEKSRDKCEKDGKKKNPNIVDFSTVSFLQAIGVEKEGERKAKFWQRRMRGEC